MLNVSYNETAVTLTAIKKTENLKLKADPILKPQLAM